VRYKGPPRSDGEQQNKKKIKPEQPRAISGVSWKSTMEQICSHHIEQVPNGKLSTVLLRKADNSTGHGGEEVRCDHKVTPAQHAVGDLAECAMALLLHSVESGG
jgi:hypothetical protein